MTCSLVFAQPAKEPGISVGLSGKPDKAAFIEGYLATASLSNLAIIDLTNGLTVRHLPQVSLVEDIEASPSGHLLAVGTCAHAIQLWDANSWTLTRRIALPQECAESVSFSPDGALLATGAYGCSLQEGIQVWDVSSGKLIAQIGSGDGFRNVVFGGDGSWIAGVDDDGIASVFAWPSGQKLQTFHGLDMAGADNFRFISSSDGRYLAWIGESLRVWDLISGKELQLPVDPHDKPSSAHRIRLEHLDQKPDIVPSTAEFLSDGRLAYVDLRDDQLVTIQLSKGTALAQPLLQSKVVWAGDIGFRKPQQWLRIRRDGKLIVGSNETRTIVWDVGAKRLRKITSPALTTPESVQWSKSGILAWVDRSSGELKGWDDRLGKPIDLAKNGDLFQDPYFVDGFALRSDGRQFAVSESLSVLLVGTASNKVVSKKDIQVGWFPAISFSPDGKHIAIGGSQNTIDLLDAKLQLQRQIATMEKDTTVKFLAFSPDDHWIAADLSRKGPTLRVWSIEDSLPPVTLDSAEVTFGPQPPVFSSDSRLLASFSQGTSLRIWSTANWNIAQSISLPGTGRALAFAPSGKRLAVALDGEAGIWDSESGRQLVTFVSPGSAQAEAVAWSPDGKRVVTSADDGVLRFWDSSDGRLLASLYLLENGNEWLLTTPDCAYDGSDWALTHLIAGRVGRQGSIDKNLSTCHRVHNLGRIQPASQD